MFLTFTFTQQLNQFLIKYLYIIGLFILTFLSLTTHFYIPNCILISSLNILTACLRQSRVILLLEYNLWLSISRWYYIMLYIFIFIINKYYAIIFGILNYAIIIYLILTFSRYSPHDVKFVFQFFIDFQINSTIFSDTLIPLIQGFPKSRNRESYYYYYYYYCCCYPPRPGNTGLMSSGG